MISIKKSNFYINKYEYMIAILYTYHERVASNTVFITWPTEILVEIGSNLCEGRYVES